MRLNPKIAMAIVALSLGTVAGATELTTELQTYGPLKQPRPVQGAKPLPNPGLDALRGDGIYLINGARVANLRAADKPGAENRYALTETTNDAKTGAVHSNIDAGNFVLNGERRPVGRPNFAIPAPDGTIYMIYLRPESIARRGDAAAIRRSRPCTCSRFCAHLTTICGRKRPR